MLQSVLETSSLRLHGSERAVCAKAAIFVSFFARLGLDKNLDLFLKVEEKQHYRSRLRLSGLSLCLIIEKFGSKRIKERAGAVTLCAPAACLESSVRASVGPEPGSEDKISGFNKQPHLLNQMHQISARWGQKHSLIVALYDNKRHWFTQKKHHSSSFSTGSHNSFYTQSSLSLIINKRVNKWNDKSELFSLRKLINYYGLLLKR